MEQMWHVPVTLAGTYWSATLAVGAESADEAEVLAKSRMERLLQEPLKLKEFQTGLAEVVVT